MNRTPTVAFLQPSLPPAHYTAQFAGRKWASHSPAGDEGEEGDVAETADQAEDADDGADDAADFAGVGGAFAVGVHAAGLDLDHVGVAHDPGDRPQDERNDGAGDDHGPDDTDDAQGQHGAAAVRHQVA